MTDEEIDIELEQKIKEWAEDYKNGAFKKHNIKLQKLLYLKHNKAEKIADCIPDVQARLELIIVEKYERKPVKMCSECGRAKCKDSCGAEDYQDKYPKAYQGADMEGNTITVGVPPFIDDIPALEIDESYIIEGKIREFNNKKEISVTKVEVPELKDSGDKVDEAVKQCEEALELFDGKVPASKFNQLTSGFSVEDLKKAMSKLGIKEIDGTMQVQKDG